MCAAHRPQKTPLNSIIYPAIGKLLQANQGDEAVIMCLAQLKVAFDNAEKVKPGISHAFVAYLIETIRAFVLAFPPPFRALSHLLFFCPNSQQQQQQQHH